MNCMKCGVELKTSGVFCEDCLADMDKYPVKPNIKVQLPPRNTPSAVRKKPKKQWFSEPEEQIAHLKKVRNRLIALLLAAVLALTAAGAAILRLLDISMDDFGIGQNYGTIDETQ